MSKAILGIDIGKAEIAVALLIESKLSGKESFENNEQGFKKLLKWLERKQTAQLKICMEATGNYGNNVAEFLYAKSHEVHVVNPVCIKAFAKSKLTRTKTDSVDAYLIAQYASITELTPYVPRSPAIKELKSLYRCLDGLKRQSVHIANQLEHIFLNL